MILIADSGSTKTDWCAADGNSLLRITTKGMNPFFQTEDEIADEIGQTLLPALGGRSIDRVYFYGAGCTPEKAPLVAEAIGRHMAGAQVSVGSDMLGAARALCGTQPGIACILGTGSNSCYYNGREIESNVSPLGFILGDEGSGAVLGKLLAGNILKNQTTPEIKEKFLAQTGLTPAVIIDRVYRQPFPNRFLASLAPFISENIAEPSIHSMVLDSFISFVRRNVMQYDWQSHPVHFTGSVAWHFRDILLQAAQATGIHTGNIVQSPMQGLVEYHTATHSQQQP